MISFHVKVTRIVPGLFHVKMLAGEFSCGTLTMNTGEFSCGTLTMNTEGLAAFKEVITASQTTDGPRVTWEET